jgi:hypothetical protein
VAELGPLSRLSRLTSLRMCYPSKLSYNSLLDAARHMPRLALVEVCSPRDKPNLDRLRKTLANAMERCHRAAPWVTRSGVHSRWGSEAPAMRLPTTTSKRAGGRHRQCAPKPLRASRRWDGIAVAVRSEMMMRKAVFGGKCKN